MYNSQNSYFTDSLLILNISLLCLSIENIETKVTYFSRKSSKALTLKRLNANKFNENKTLLVDFFPGTLLYTGCTISNQAQGYPVTIV